MTASITSIDPAEPRRATTQQLRIVVAGHVDHGKSTFIGRLLYETGSLPDGRLEKLQEASARRGMPFEWSFLLDALQTERDQGVTIDTTQINFRTSLRDVLLIDAPGHLEFLRNMITGAAQADAAILIVDATEGVRDQTRRHGYLLELLGIRQIVVAINKMDRFAFSQTRFQEIEGDIAAYLLELGIRPTAVIPISARDGDGVAQCSLTMRWYQGPSVLEAIDALTVPPRLADLSLRLPIQAIYKFDERRILAGRIETGCLEVGDEIVIMPGGKIAKVKTIEDWPGPASGRREAGQSIGITLDRELFVERGDVISHVANAPFDTKRLRARVFWLHSQPLVPGASILLRIGTHQVRGQIVVIEKVIDPGELAVQAKHMIASSQVGEIVIALARPIAADVYRDNARTGRLVMEIEGRIAGGGLVLSIDQSDRRSPVDIVPVRSALRPEQRTARFQHTGAVVWFTGLPGAGKTTLARALEQSLFNRGGSPILLDGDTLRAGLNSDLGFSPADRSENIRRLAEVAAHLARNGHIAIVAAVSPSADDRARARQIAPPDFFEIYLSTPPQICESRDPKGHYAKARAGVLQNFTGLGTDYEPPSAPELTIDTSDISIEAALSEIDSLLRTNDLLRMP